MTDGTDGGAGGRRRGRERRLGLDSVLAHLSRSVLARPERESWRAAFETALQRVLPLEGVALTNGPLSGRRSSSRAAHATLVGFEVPTGDGTPRTALEARVAAGRRLDAWDLQVLETAAVLAGLILEVDRLARRSARVGLAAHRPDRADPLVGSSAPMCELRDHIERMARTPFTVLIEGESGTGKELVARHLHGASGRAGGPFVAVNCAALVESLLEAELFGIEDRTATGVRGRRGKFEHAEGGTIFLDEVSDLSLPAQAKLLRAIQDLAVERVGSCGAQRVDIRIVAATNRSLSGLIERGLFRQDLYYRLCGIELHVPALRDRGGDILELADHFLRRHERVRPLGLSAAAADVLLAYEWPGNVRELERVIERAVALARGNRIEVDDLPPVVRGPYAEALLPALVAGDSMRAWGSRYARLVLERCSHNKRRACRMLGISYHTLQAYLRVRPSSGRSAVHAWPPARRRAGPVNPTSVHETRPDPHGMASSSAAAAGDRPQPGAADGRRAPAVGRVASPRGRGADSAGSVA